MGASVFSGSNKRFSLKHNEKIEWNGIDPSGIFVHIRKMHSLENPLHVGLYIIRSPTLKVVRDAVRLWLLSSDVDSISQIEVDDAIVLVFEPQWQNALHSANRFALTEQGLLTFRIEILELLLQVLPDACTLHKHRTHSVHTLKQRVLMWMTAHVPLHIHFKAGTDTVKSRPSPQIRQPTMTLSVGVHLLPDMSGTVQNLDYNNMFGNKTNIQSAFAHIMSKALPRRCQIRELSRFLLDYFKLYLPLQLLFDRMLLLSLLGLYPSLHLSTTPSWKFETVVQLYILFLLPNRNNTHIGSDLLRHPELAGCKNIQALFFCVIRELLKFQIQMIPALSATLKMVPGWDDFDWNVETCMQQMRLHLCANISSNGLEPSTISCIADYLFASLCKSRINQKASRSLTVTECMQKLLFQLQKVITVINGSEWPNILLSLQQYKQADNQGSTGILSRILQSSSHEIGSTLEVQSKTQVVALFRDIHANGMKNTHRQFVALKEGDILRFYRLYHEVANAVHKLATTVHPLPVHLWARQVLVLERAQRRYGVNQLLPHSNNLLLCQSCGSMKCSIDVSVKHTKKTQGQHTTLGSVDVTVDDNAEVLYCSRPGGKGKKQAEDVYTQGGASMVPDYTCVQDAPELLEYDTYTSLDIQNLYCSNICITRVPLLGNVVCHIGKMYTVCVQCGCITELVQERIHTCLCSACHASNVESAVAKHLTSNVTGCGCCGVNYTETNLYKTHVVSTRGRHLVHCITLCMQCNRIRLLPEQAQLTYLHELQQRKLLRSCRKELSSIGLKSTSRKRGNSEYPDRPLKSNPKKVRKTAVAS